MLTEDELDIKFQDDHDEEFTFVPSQRIYVDRCVTCKDQVLWGCSIYKCRPTESCFIICPTCGKHGNTEPPVGFVPDLELAKLLRKALSIPEPWMLTSQ